MYQSELYIAEETMHSRLEARRDRRLARQELAELGSGNRYVSPALGWLGSRLVAWGSRLQERYSTATASPQPANRLLS